MTDPRELGEMTLSMIRGEQGARQRSWANSSRGSPGKSQMSFVSEFVLNSLRHRTHRRHLIFMSISAAT